MTTPLALPEGLASDWLSLSALIADTAERQDVPCLSGTVLRAAMWTSDDSGDQELATQACAPCPVLIQCRRYGLAHSDEQGTYGGLTETQRRTVATRAKENR